MSWLFLEAADVWFFRDGRPFTSGQDFTANTIFPPTPFTVQGALRSLILGHTAVDWEDFIFQRGTEAADLGQRIGHPGRNGEPASLGQFSIQGPLVARWPDSHRAEILSPLPQDTFYNADGEWKALRPKKQSLSSWTNWPDNLQPLQAPKKSSKHPSPPKEKSGLLDQGGRDAYAKGEGFSLWDRDARGESTFVPEQRLGIAIDYQIGHAQDQMIYQAQFMRPCASDTEKYGLLIKLGNGVELPSEGVLALGGEARAAHFFQLDEKVAPIPLPHMPKSKRFKIILHTPAWFSDGWQPKKGGWTEVFDVSPAANLQCVAVALGKPQYIGGWDLARAGHKVMRNFIPAGSVYYFTADDTVTLPSNFTETPIDTLDFAAQGFGVYASVEWDWL